MPDPLDRARLPRYERPSGDEPLDAIEQAFVKMWIRIIAREMRADIAAGRWPPPEDDEPA